MHRLRLVLVGLLAALLTAGGLVVVSTTSADAMTPSPGPEFNNPLAKARKRVNLKKINGAIDSAPPGSAIRIASWNFRNGYAVQALLRAHRRGVSVQLVMDLGNANKKVPNKYMANLQRGLAQGNAGRPPGMESFAMKCRSSCRGNSGIAHTKFFLFSQSGAASHVVIYGSSNLTDLAATNQWNDTYTVTGDSAYYGFMQGIFNEMVQDRAQPAPYRTGNFSQLGMAIFPDVGPGASSNPIVDDLNKVACQPAGNGRGQTTIRIGITAVLGQLGQDIANKLHQLWNLGCDVKIVYAVMGNNVLKAFRAPGPRGGVPIKQVVQDFNHDGVYDRYLHTKFLAISGNYAGKQGNYMTINGSANWTPVAMVSDETYAHVPGRDNFNAYAAFVDYWYAHAPKSWSRRTKHNSADRLAPGNPDHVLRKGVNPYKKMQLD